MSASNSGTTSISLWSAPVPAGRPDMDALAAAGLSYLDQTERAAAARLRQVADRCGHIVSHAALRAALSMHAGGRVPPGRWRFTRSTHGQPAVDTTLGLPALHFSLSRCQGLAVVAVSPCCPVGVDVEALDRPMGRMPVDVALSPAERARLENIPVVDRPGHFLTLWTLKEAYAKLRGQGVSIPFDRLDFTLAPPRLHRTEAGKPPEDLHLETRRLVTPRGAYVVSLAVRCPPGGSPIVTFHTLDSSFRRNTVPHQQSLSSVSGDSPRLRG